MFDHLTIRASDRTAAERFYDTVLAPLSIDPDALVRSATFSGWDEFAVAQADGPQDVTTRLHVAFIARTQAAVDAFWEAGTAAGYSDDGAPGPRPAYADDYYAAYLRDPDGNGIEAVYRDGPRRADGIVDHARVRVTDVARSADLYRRVAQVVGAEVRRDTPEMLLLAGANGGVFSLIADEPTRNAHIAFTADADAVARFRRDVGAGDRAYVLDPDDNRVEVADGRPDLRRN
jgi:catechol 2,3-dioxygenase-like lactoylglutathione lyase family enzyme